jgi:glycosyltransferase involved in cell wall biosynthesis
VEFAVIIPTSGRPHLVVEAVESIVRQTYRPAEVIVVLDGPDDITRAALEAWDVIVVEQARSGVAVARNTGIARSTASWLTFLDDDDMWHPDRLRVTAEFLRDEPRCRAFNAGYWNFADADSARPGDLVATTLDECLEQSRLHPDAGSDLSYLDVYGRSYDLLLERNRGDIMTATVERSTCLASGGFPPGLTTAEDWVFFLRVARLTEWFHLSQRLAFHRRHRGNNTTANPTNGVVNLQALRMIWDDPEHAALPHRPLAEYGDSYRWTVQEAVWGALQRRRLRLALKAAVIGVPLLPRRRDRLYAFTPPPITWRLERLMSRVRKRKKTD